MTSTRGAEEHVEYSWHYAANQGPSEHDCCRIAVIGVGRVGNDTVTKLMDSGMTSAKCIAISTNVTHLNGSKANHKILIGERLTKNLRRSNPEPSRAAIEEFRKRAEEVLSNVDIAFVTAGLSDGTGAGAAPRVAEIAKRKGALTIGFVTMPLKTEKDRGTWAAKALAEMRKQCDTVVVIDDYKLAQSFPNLRAGEAHRAADQILASMIKEIVETISTPSLINLDFSNFKTVVTQGGMAAVGVGESDAPNRAEEAVRNALRNPLMDVDYSGATGALIHVIGDNHLTVEEANHVGEIVTEMMDRNALVVWGASVNPQQEGRLKVTLVMTGVNSSHNPRRLEAIAPQLFNLEPCGEPQTSIDIKLDLYQMETDSK